MTSQQKDLVRELRGEHCAPCGGPKKSRQTFCRACYFRLPPALRKALYTPLGDGYERHYEAARKFLDVTSKGGRRC